MTGKRALARARTEAAIIDSARAQLTTLGAANLSLREVARDIGMVSSAVYRYVDSRDQLLTMLIVDAYNRLGDAVEQAAATGNRQSADGRSDVQRWVDATHAIRAWAHAHYHEYLLLYGTPVPGYEAPTATIEPGTRTGLALLSIVAEAHRAGRLAHTSSVPAHLSDRLASDVARFAEMADLPNDVGLVATVLAAWSQAFGLITFELTNQTRGAVTDHEALFAATAHLSATAIGLRS